MNKNKKSINTRRIDHIMWFTANSLNLLMVLVFLSRTLPNPRLEFYAGILLLLLALPTLYVMIKNIQAQRGTWYWLLPLLLVLFLIVELLLDHIFFPDFRQSRLLGPYLGLYYLSLMAMIGYSFMTSKKAGFITLITYFLNQVATFYSYFKVGH